jgi:threonine/homoserine/homoserine lactone efflux protein
MDFNLLGYFAVTCVLLALAPGPDNICVLTESTTRGKLRGFVLALGFTTGVTVHTFLCATGLAIIIKNSAVALLILKAFGAVYLTWLAIEAFREKPTMKSFGGNGIEPVGAKIKSLSSLYFQGFVMNVVNPKVIIFFLAFLPGFVRPEASVSETAQFFVFGLIFMLVTIVVFGGVAVLGGTLRPLLAKAGFWRAERWVRVVLFGTLAIFIAFGIGM